MASIQRIFPAITRPALSFLRRPSRAFAAWTQTSAVFSQAGARYVGPTQGTAQQVAAPVFNAIPLAATHTLLLGQFVSDPLRAQTIPAGNWQIAFGAALLNAAATYTWAPVAALFVMDAQGTRRATLFDLSAVGASGRTTTTERSALASIAGASVQIATGDCLVLEVGIGVSNLAAATAPQARLYAQGTTPITADDVAISDALASLEGPAALALSLPQPGESPDASVTFAQALQIVQDHWPPNTGVLYDWDNPETLIGQVFLTLRDVVKLYGYDQVDRVIRELNPLRIVEQVPAWEALLGITLSDAASRLRSTAKRRATVIARVREMGPLTIHNLAAIFSTLANYVAPDVPEVIDVRAADMEAANVYTDPIAGAIPTGTGFDATNLLRYTPTLLDGGEVWQAGVLVTLNLSAAQSENLHIRLRGPGGVDATWTGGPNLTTAVKLRSPAHAGEPIHGLWQLNVYRNVGSPAVTLNSWSLYTLGKTWGGREGMKHIWSIYLDAAHQTVERRDIETTLDRITQSYTEGFVIFDTTSIPGTNTHRAGRFIPGA